MCIWHTHTHNLLSICLFVNDCCRSVTQLCPTLCDPMDCSTPSFPFVHSLLRVCSNSCSLSWWCIPTISFCLPLLLLPSIFPRIRVFPNESAHCIRWPKYWSFSISPSSDYSGLIYFRIDCFDFLAVHKTLKSFLQHHNLKAWILWHSAFFMVQLSHLYMTTGKTIAEMIDLLLLLWPDHLWNIVINFFKYSLLS